MPYEAPDPVAVARETARLKALSGQDPTAFRREFTSNVVPSRRDPILTAAFRSDDLCVISLGVADAVISEISGELRKKPGTDPAWRQKQGDPEWRRRQEWFRTLVGQERNILRRVVEGSKAKRGILAAQPNPLNRAQKRLWQLALQGDLPAGTARRLLDEEKERDRAATAQRKAERDARRRNARTR